MVRKAVELGATEKLLILHPKKFFCQFNLAMKIFLQELEDENEALICSTHKFWCEFFFMCINIFTVQLLFYSTHFILFLEEENCDVLVELVLCSFKIYRHVAVDVYFAFQNFLA